jgi:hypothetical protein
MIVIVIVPIVLRRLADNCADSRSGRPSDQSALDAAAERCAKYSTGSAANKRAFAWANATLVVLIVVVAMMMMVISVVAAVHSAAGSVVELAIVLPPLGGCRRHNAENRAQQQARCKQQCEHSCHDLSVYRSDAVGGR